LLGIEKLPQVIIVPKAGNSETNLAC
jgi:hypothetical protein